MSQETKSKKTRSNGVGSMKLKGWRKFKDEINVELGRVNFLMGPNNAGKTSFLSAFRFISLMSQEGWPVLVPKKLNRKLEDNLLHSGSQDGSMRFKFGNSELSFQIKRGFLSSDISVENVILSNGSFRIEALLPEEHRMMRYLEEGSGPFLIGDISSKRPLIEVESELESRSNDLLSILEKLKGFEASPGVIRFLTSLKIDSELLISELEDFYYDTVDWVPHQCLGQISTPNGIWYVVLTNRYYLEAVYCEKGFEVRASLSNSIWFEGEVPAIEEWDGLWASKNWDRWSSELKKGASSPFEAMLKHVVPGNEESSLVAIQEAFGKWRFNLETSFMGAKKSGMPMADKSNLRSLTDEYSALAHSLWDGAAMTNVCLPSICNSVFVDRHVYHNELSLQGTFSDYDENINFWTRRIREFYTTDFLSDFKPDVLWIPPGSSELQNTYFIDSSPFPNFLFRDQDAYLDRDKREMDFELSRCLMYLGFGGGFRLIKRKSTNLVQLVWLELDFKRCPPNVSLSSIRKSNNSVFKEGGRGWLKSGRVPIHQMGRAASNLIWLMLTLMETKLSGASKVVVLEEPGAFMHPRIASRFTDVIRHLAEFLDIIVFVETHNEYMIRQLSTSRLNGDVLEDVRIHYFGAPGKGDVLPIKVDKDGVFTPAIPDGFLDKSSSMMREQRELKRKRDTK